MNFVHISPKLLAPRLPELGQIKIGGKGEVRKSRGGKEFRLPVKYTHFVIATRERDEKTENLIPDRAIHAKLGEKPTRLDVRLLFDDPAANFQYFLAAYDGRRKRCSGNGETAIDREHGPVPCTCPWLKIHEGPYAGPKREVGRGAPTCKPHGRLSVILEAAESFGGFYTFRTTSWESIRSIAAQLELYRQQFGYLAGLPLWLTMYPTTDTYEEGGVVKTSSSYKVALTIRGSFDTARQIAASAYQTREQLALPSPEQATAHQQQLLEDEEREAVAAEISAEFHPESRPPEEWVDVEIVDEVDDQETQYLERLCRLTLEYADWEPAKINRQIAKYSDRLAELADVLKEKLTGRYEKAEQDLAQEAIDQAEEDGTQQENAERAAESASQPELF